MPAKPSQRKTPRVDPNSLDLYRGTFDESGPVRLFAGGGGEGAAELSAAEREDMLRTVRRHMAGQIGDDEKAPRLELEAVTFIQRETPNRNFVRFKTGILPTFAKSFVGMPVLRDHATYSLEARAGTITESKLEHVGGAGGDKAIRMRLVLTALWAIEAALLGNFDRFSIGWHRTGIMECSVHGTRVWSKCDCWLGEEVAGPDGATLRVEWVITGADGVEVSGVNVPAVVGTSITGERQLALSVGLDLAERDDILATDNTPKESPNMDPQLLAALKLKDGATVADAVAAIAALQRTADEATDKLTLVEERLTTLEAADKARADELKKTRAASVTAKLNELCAAGKLKPGSKSEDALKRMADRDYDAFASQCADLLEGPSVTPVNAELPGLKLDAKQTPTGDALASRPELGSWLSKAGITPEQFEQHGGLDRLKTIQSRG